MKVKTSELQGIALDWAVGTCLGLSLYIPAFAESPWVQVKDPSGRIYICPSWSTEWAQGGPIIEREGIDLRFDSDCWIALMCGVDYDAPGMPDEYPYGPTPLIAAMRCYVASKLGDEVDVPDTLNP